MAVKFSQGIDGKPRYQLIEEKVSDLEIQSAKINLADARDYAKGYNKTKTMKLSMEIPKAVLYNYLVINGIPSHQHNIWLKDKKNITRLKKDFPMFCL